MHSTTQQILDTKILPLFYHDDYDLCKSNIIACHAAGVKVFEFTNRGKLALAHFQRLKKELSTSHSDLKLGVGTIYTVAEAKAFAAAGADFIVQPVCIKAVAKFCKTANIPWVPGVMTLNEIYQAMLLGAELIKVFPGNLVGKDYIKSIRGPLPGANLMVTGGVEATPEDVKSWLAVGVKACGLGSQLFAQSPESITKTLTTIVNSIHE
jgi:2-dehydro-3-deoxyphosphogluconate aldolase / (4S)-4-hydroxy-2-oxoglutarate aldolase